MERSITRTLPSRGVQPTAPQLLRPAVAQPATATASYWPFCLVLAYLVVDYGRPQNWIPGLGLLRPGMFVLGGGMLALFSQSSIPKDRLSKYVMGVMALMVILVPLSLNRHRAFDQTWSFVLFVFGAVLPIVAFVNSFERLRTLIRFWVALHVSLALYAMTHNGLGIGSFLTDENDFAVAMNVALPYAAALFVLEEGASRRLFALVAIAFMLLATVATFSRGGFIGLTCVLVVLWLYSRRKLTALVLCGVLGGLVFTAIPKRYWSEMETISTADQEGDTGFERLYSWGIGWRMFLDNPILGVGPNNYPFRAAEYETATSDEIGYHMWGRAAHSLYFTLLPELGVVGTVLFVGMVGSGIRLRWRLRRHAAIAMANPDLTDDQRRQARWFHQLTGAIDAALAGYLTSGAFVSVLYYPHVWLLTAFTAVLWRVASEQQLTGEVPFTAAVAAQAQDRSRFVPTSSRIPPRIRVGRFSKVPRT